MTWAKRGRRGLALALLGALLGCQSTYYDEYKAKHPGFDPTLPRLGATLPELLAALHAPDQVEKIERTLARLRVFQVEGEDWREIPFDAIRSGREGVSDEADYAVLVAWQCRFDQGLNESGSQRAGFYLLTANRVTAYDHYAFRERCASDNEFLAARQEAIRTEREALRRLAGSGTRFSLVQAYHRGLAYVEAGRLPEARGMLLLGERSYRGSAERLRAAGRSDVLLEAERLRSALMRALGVEVRPPEDAAPQNPRP